MVFCCDEVVEDVDFAVRLLAGSVDEVLAPGLAGELVEDEELVALEPIPMIPMIPAGTEDSVLLAAVIEELAASEPATDPVDKEDEEIVPLPDATSELAEESIPELINDLVKDEELVLSVAVGELAAESTDRPAEVRRLIV
ncbi:MAG: hypothetical protein M1813_003349 [Trichoglossum hirsutum]|nr:MAG: hypothetical protein M1813_003349 [Trichoglossum hirsutum]